MADNSTENKKGLTLTRQIILGLIIGVIAGAVVSEFSPDLAQYFKPFSTIFIRMIKMIIAPLLFSTLVAGVAGAGHVKTVGRMGIRSIIYFEIVTTIALAIGLFAVNVVRPGVGLNLPNVAPDIATKAQTWDQVLVHVFPTSIFQAMAEGDVLQIVVFSILFAVALGMIGEKGKPIIQFCESVAETMFKFTAIIMRYAPIGVGCSIAYTVGHGGLKTLANLAMLVGTLYGALIVFIIVVFVPIAFMCKISVSKFFAVLKEPVAIAFSTTSSEAALPGVMHGLEVLGVPRKIVSFVLPLGYSFNLTGTTLYLSLATVFVAQAANVEFSISQQVTMLLILMLTSKGVAGVPRSSLVILAGTLASYNLPLEGITLLLGVDGIMDMARTTVNVIGNALAAIIVAKWEGEYDEASDEEIAERLVVDA